MILWYIVLPRRSTFTFDTGVGDIKEAPNARKYQEVRGFIIAFGVYGLSDRQRRAKDKSFQDEGHH